MNQQPIFIGVTRSFWAAVTGVALFFSAGDAVLEAIGLLIDPIFGLEAGAAGEWLKQFSPLVLFVAALQQRSGAVRPYTMDPRTMK